MTPVEWAAIEDDLAQARLLVASGADVNHVDKLGWTALQWAANIDHGNSEMIKFLLANGARRDLKNKQGQTALDIATKYGYKRHVTMLERAEQAQQLVPPRAGHL